MVELSFWYKPYVHCALIALERVDLGQNVHYESGWCMFVFIKINREHAHITFVRMGNSNMCMIMYIQHMYGCEYVCTCACMHWLIRGGYMFCVFVLCAVIVYIDICKHNYP